MSRKINIFVFAIFSLAFYADISFAQTNSAIDYSAEDEAFLEEEYEEYTDGIANVPAVIINAEEPEKADPIQAINRTVHKFNDTIDGLLLAPISRGYRATVPEWGRNKVSNAVSNISSPVTFLNNILQGDVEGAFTTFWRFTLNSTIGIGGIFDIASEAGLKKRQEDFGQTLGVYGIGSGPYIVIPILGPSNGRDLIGKTVDSFTNPFNYLTVGTVIGIQATEIVSKREKLLDYTDDVAKNSFDPYSTIKSAYIQYRQDAIVNGKKNNLTGTHK